MCKAVTGCTPDKLYWVVDGAGAADIRDRIKASEHKDKVTILTFAGKDPHLVVEEEVDDALSFVTTTPSSNTDRQDPNIVLVTMRGKKDWVQVPAATVGTVDALRKHLSTDWINVSFKKAYESDKYRAIQQELDDGTGLPPYVVLSQET
eukprot:TRINITY_DN34457_c0_g1_i1.p1 TRINITY_DN34457_c0_g1~~TRINITY_DN34457_c0_g1_i1.p1  ORF type:complete len:149 (+),score=19.79 TRINITY_DN34457_c0_g1_i1:396-842(+)